MSNFQFKVHQKCELSSEILHQPRMGHCAEVIWQTTWVWTDNSQQLEPNPSCAVPTVILFHQIIVNFTDTDSEPWSLIYQNFTQILIILTFAKNHKPSIHKVVGRISVRFHDTISTRSNQKYSLTTTLKAVHEFPTVHSISDKWLTMWHKDYQLHLMYVCTLPCKVIRVWYGMV